MKKLGVVMFVLVLVACTESVPPRRGSRPEDEPEGPISIQVSGEPEETRVWQALVERFEEDNPDADVELIEVADGEDHLASLATGFAGGEAPDVFLINYREYAQFVVRDAVEPLADLMTERGLDLDDYYEQSMEAFTFDGELRCMPQNISSLVVYFNKQVFQDAGLEPPYDGWTFEEFAEAARTLTGGDVHGLGVDPQIIRIAPFVWSNGGEITDDPVSPTRFTLDEPAAREVLEAFVGLVREGVVPDEKEIASADIETRFINGELGMLMSSRRDTPLFREATDLKWDVLPLPTFDEPASILHSDALCISSDSEALGTAADLVAFAMGTDGQTLLALSGRTVPSLEQVATSGAFLDPSQPPAHSEVWLDATSVIRNTPVLATWPEIEAVAEEILTKAFYEEDYSVDDAIRELEEQTTPLFEEAAAG